jgi:hypothetical protein
MNKFLLILLMVLLVSCHQSQSKRVNENETPLTGFPKTGNIQFSVLAKYEEYMPGKMHLLDSAIIIHRERVPLGENWIEILNLDGKRLSSFLSNGRGPEELLSISSSGIINKKLWLYDFQNSMLWLVDDVITTDAPTNWKKTKIRKRFFTVELWNDSILLAISEITGANYKIDAYNYLSDKLIEGFGNLSTIHEVIDVIPFTGKIYPGIDLFIEKGLFNGNYRIKPDGSSIAVAYNYFDAIEIYAANREFIKAIRGPQNIFPQLKSLHQDGGYGLLHPDDTKLGYRAMICTDDYIYAAFSGASYFDYEANKIFVFDWDGNAIKSFNLNYPIGSFCVDEKESTIYSVSTNTGELIKGTFNLD